VLWASVRFEGCLEHESTSEVHRHRTGSSGREMKATRSSFVVCEDEGSRSSSQKNRRMAAKLPELFRHGVEARVIRRQPRSVCGCCLLLVCVVGIATGQTGQAEPRTGWKSIRYQDLSWDIPEAFVVQQGRVPLLSLIAVFFWSSWTAPRPLMFAAVLHQSGPNLLPEEEFMQVLQRFQLENALTLAVPLIGEFDFDPATIQVSAYVSLGAPVREVRARSRESGEYYRLYLLTHTLANDSTIRSYLAVVGCAEERMQDDHSVLHTILASMKLQ
jgi:hypothetical protein